MSDDSDPPEEPAAGDGPDADGTGSGADGKPDAPVDEEPTGDATDAGTDGETTDDGADGTADDGEATDDERVDDGTGDEGAAEEPVDDREADAGSEDQTVEATPTRGYRAEEHQTGTPFYELMEEAEAAETEDDADEGADATGAGDGDADDDPSFREMRERSSSTPATPGAEPTATGDGGVESSARGAAERGMNAAEKGMNAVNDGLDAIGGAGPESDQEMPLTEHIEEMMRRLSVVFAVGIVVSLAVLFIGSVSPTVPSAAEIVRFFWDAHVGYEQYRPHVYGPLEFLLTKLKVAGLAGLFVGLPVLVYETYLFMRPGLYPNERRYYLAAIPTSFVLGLVGAAFAHVAVLPFVFDYFIAYSRENAILAFGLSDTFNLILLLIGYFAVVFQIPLFMQLAVMMNVVSREWMEDRRLLFWGAFLGLAFTFIAADPTGFASIIVAATMIVLFEMTLILLRWTGN